MKNCEFRREERHYCISYNPMEFDEYWKGQKDPDGKVHLGLEHLLQAWSTNELCHPKASMREGMICQNF